MRGTPDENAAALQGSLAYFDTYSVDEAKRTITTVVVDSTFPSSEGETLKRFVTWITADTLVCEWPSTTRCEREGRSIAGWNRQQAGPNAERVAKRRILMTLIRHARQCRD